MTPRIGVDLQDIQGVKYVKKSFKSPCAFRNTSVLHPQANPLLSCSYLHYCIAI